MIKDMAMNGALAACDLVFALIPQPKPSPHALNKCKIVSHRGEHDNVHVRENTLAAFEAARRAGAWGIEFDIRWTKDLVPVVHHDADTSRVFGTRMTIAECNFETLREMLPEIPLLAEVIGEFGGNTHLMMEIKEEPFPELVQQKAVLKEHFSSLESRQDFHVLALDPDLFETFDIFPKASYLPVAMLNTSTLSKIALERGYGGLTGHYVLMGKACQEAHEGAGQGIGPGFIHSRNSLCRELNREVEWIFTNDAVKLMGIVAELKDKVRP